MLAGRLVNWMEIVGATPYRVATEVGQVPRCHMLALSYYVQQVASLQACGSALTVALAPDFAAVPLSCIFLAQGLCVFPLREIRTRDDLRHVFSVW